MLDQVGLDYRVVPSDLDEGAVKASFTGDVAALTQKLAAEKALAVSRSEREALVIGSDSVAYCDDIALDKPRDREEAAEHLRMFSGKSLYLHSSVALTRDEETLFNAHDVAELKVRKYSEEFIQTYLEMDWPAVRFCVGVFRLEGPGALLFDKITGSHFTVLGMPLLPLLGALRDEGFLPT
ncbi:MAG: septum formation protein Maf [Sphingomonas sp.]|nr:septum formation protein Maf [Sphingomonas sp.]RZV52399.1 MAG: septum formation protein Maf [Sphingomonadaceae bacterium]